MDQSTSIVSSSDCRGKEIVTQLEDTSLNSLKPTDTDKTINVKVYRKWTPTNKQGKPVLFCCILIDRQGGAIQANVNLRDKPKFDAMLQINRTCKITGFGFQPARTWMQVVPHSLSLAFGTYTDIKDIPDEDFPSHYFHFSQYRDLHSKIDVREGLLTDYIGCVQYVTEIQRSLKQTQDSAVWRDIGIQNLDGHTVRFTLWNEDANAFRADEYERAEKPAIIAVSSCVVKHYGGLQLSSTSATSYYFNPDIPECHEIRAVYDQFIEPPAIANVQHQRFADPQQEKHRNRVTLADLMKENPQNQQGVRFTVVATIQRIITKRAWFFKKCVDCKLKISERFPHAHCEPPKSENDQIYSYCFRVELVDNTGNGTMTCFSTEANSMLKDCRELVQATAITDPYDYPPEILDLQGKTKIFQLHFDPDSTKENRIFILDTCWDDTPLITTKHACIAQSSLEFSEEQAAEQPPDTPTSNPILLPDTTTDNIEAASPTISTRGKTPLTTENKPVITPASEQTTLDQTSTTKNESENEGTISTPPEETSLIEPSKAKNEQNKGNVRRKLFSEGNVPPAAESPKKSRKAD